MAPADSETPDYVSKAIGDFTRKARSKSWTIGQLGKSNIQERQEGARLLRPEELRGLSADDCVLLIHDSDPVLAKKVRYFEDKVLKKIFDDQSGDHSWYIQQQVIQFFTIAIHRLARHVCMPEKDIVWTTKYRFKVLKGAIRLRIREIIRQTCEAMGVKIMSGVLSSDHVHMFVEIPPSIAVSDFVQRVKGRSSHKIQREFPELGKRYWGQRFWARGYFCTTSGNISNEIIENYLKNHLTTSAGFQPDTSNLPTLGR